MLTSHLRRLLSLVVLVAGGCDGNIAASPTETDSSSTFLTNYSPRPNGTGIHIASTQPASWFGLTNASTTWFMSGFSQRSDGTWWATGWYSLSVGLLPADALVLSVLYNGTSSQLQGIRTAGSRLSIDLRDAAGAVTTLEHSALVGLNLSLSVPDPVGLTRSDYTLRFTSADSVDSQFGDVDGYQVDYKAAALLGGSWSSYCKGADGGNLRSVFYQGSQWSPMDGARQDGANLVTMTCETGSVAKCMRWGYRPWATGENERGQVSSLRDHHQACIHMKRASYCGDSQSGTVDGTSITIRDLLNPAISSGALNTVEALWGPSGATCVSNRRHPEIPFVGCPMPLPACPANPLGGYLLANGIPGPGSLFGVTD